MPNSKSAKKNLRQNVARRGMNRTTRSAVRTQIRKVREAIQAGDHNKGTAELKLVCKELDQAAAQHIIHANAAARTKSRLNAAVKAIAS